MKTYVQSHWKAVLSINLILGIALWFGFFTDISLRGTILDILFPPSVAILALLTMRTLPAETKKIGKVAYMPSLIGGGLYTIMGVVLLLPPFTLAFLFGASEIADELKIQRLPSPNNANFADVYFRPVGPYTSGSGKIYIRIVSKY